MREERLTLASDMARCGQRFNRDSLAVAAAFALHALALALVHRFASSLPLDAPHAARPLDDVEVDLMPAESGQSASRSEPPLVAPESAHGFALRTARAPSRELGGVPSRAPAVAPSRAPELSASEPLPEATFAPTDASPEAPPPSTPSGVPHPIDLGIGPDAWQSWALAQPATPAPAERAPRGRPIFRAPPVSSTGGLQEGLEKHDLSLGIGPAGRVATALYRSAHSPDAPEVGTALFHVTVLKDGAVEVSLAEGADKRWQAVATHAAEALRQAPPRIPPPRSGYRLTLKITAEEVMPNGLRRKDLHGARVAAVPPRLHDVREAQKEAELKNPTAGVGPDRQDVSGSPMILEMPGIYVEGQGKACGYRFGITPFGLLLQGGCDPANAVAKFQRVVRTEVREQEAF